MKAISIEYPKTIDEENKITKFLNHYEDNYR